MKKTFMLILALMLITVLTACGGTPAATSGSGPADSADAAGTQETTEAPLVIYHISDDEIELHFTSDNLESILY